MYLYRGSELCGGAVCFYITYRNQPADEDNPVVGEHPPVITTNRDGDDSVITSSRFLLRSCCTHLGRQRYIRKPYRCYP